jgi:hypothetical protein
MFGRRQPGARALTRAASASVFAHAAFHRGLTCVPYAPFLSHCHLGCCPAARIRGVVVEYLMPLQQKPTEARRTALLALFASPSQRFESLPFPPFPPSFLIHPLSFVIHAYGFIS